MILFKNNFFENKKAMKAGKYCFNASINTKPFLCLRAKRNGSI